MRIIVGTYRGHAYLPRALRSIHRHLTGWDRIDFVDDSGDAEFRALLQRWYPESVVVDAGKQGYNNAMQEVVKLAGDEEFMFWEEDFTATVPVDLAQMSQILTARPHLAQVALLRQPWFPNERKAGGLLEALAAKGHEIRLIDGIHEQRATFTGNPAVWQAGIAALGWPRGQWSEDQKRDELLAEGYSFGFLEGVRVRHEGVRSGFDY